MLRSCGAKFSESDLHHDLDRAIPSSVNTG